MPAAPRFNPREMMELAIKVMLQSIAEGRDDKKASPLVGAVLVKPDGSVATAHRGELREGDHAEYTLLERKHRDARLDGAVLFATLEPCAPGARKHPKLSCAERIVNARIKEVWVGIEDPDPTVDRQGLRYLESKGVVVHMFPPDLQTQIRAANRTFLQQATVRAAEAKARPAAAPGATTDWTKPMPEATQTDLSESALRVFRQKLGVSFTAAKLEQLLLAQGFLARQGRKVVPTKVGWLAFATTPRHRLPQAGLKGTIHYADGREEVRDFDGPLIFIPSEVERWLGDKLPLTSDRSRMVREDKTDAPLTLVREAVINALVHRDYDVEGATCHLAVTNDTITVRSPGLPPSPITLEQLRGFNAPMLNRNPRLQFAFGSARLAEGRGLGMKTLAEAATKLGLPQPRYAFDGVYLNLTIYRHSEAAVRTMDKAILDSLNRDELAAWKLIATRSTVTSPEMIETLQFDERKVQRILKKLQGHGLLRRAGKGPATRYEVLR